MSGASLNRSGLKAAGPSGLTAFPSEESPEASERYEGLRYWRFETADLRTKIWEEFLKLESHYDRVEFLAQLIRFLADTLTHEITLGERSLTTITINAVRRSKTPDKARKTTIKIRVKSTEIEVVAND